MTEQEWLTWTDPTLLEFLRGQASVQSVAVPPDGKRIAVGDSGGGIQVWELGKVLA
jgi:hypothetical protein